MDKLALMQVGMAASAGPAMQGDLDIRFYGAFVLVQIEILIAELLLIYRIKRRSYFCWRCGFHDLAAAFTFALPLPFYNAFYRLYRRFACAGV